MKFAGTLRPILALATGLFLLPPVCATGFAAPAPASTAALILATALIPSTAPAPATALAPVAVSAPIAVAHPGSASTGDLDLPARSEERFHELPDFRFVDADGREWTKADLAGEPWVCVLFFASCSGPCPRLSADVRALLQEPLATSDVRIVSLSVDPEHDRGDVLREYAATYTADPDRWLFLTGDEAEVHRFVREGLKLGVEKPMETSDLPETAGGAGSDESADGSDGGSADAPAGDAELDSLLRLAERMQVTHSTRLVAVDVDGRVAGWYECGSEAIAAREEIEASFEALANRLLWLDGRPLIGSERPILLPTINATLNGIAAVLLVLGLLAIRRDRRELHAGLMISAFGVSALFLACYVYYHVVVLPLAGGPTPFRGTGLAKTGYLILLASHVILAAVNLPMVLRTLFLAHRERWDAHRRWARWTFPMWLYVSVTGVLVYLLLYVYDPS